MPPETALHETFGWQPANYGVLLVCFGVWGAFAQARHEPLEWAMLAVCVALGAALLSWEVRRRARRAVLVPDGDKFAIYRDGGLVRVAGRRDFIVFLPDSLNTFKSVLGLGAFALGMLFAALAAPRGDEKGMALLAGCVFVSSAVSSYRSRTLCTEFTLLEAEGKPNSRLMLSHADGARLLNAGTAAASLKPPTTS